MNMGLNNLLVAASAQSTNPIKEILSSENPITQVSHSEYWGSVIAIVVTGLTVVFLILLLLVFFLWVLGKIFNKKKKTIKDSSVNTNNAVSEPVFAEVELEESDDSSDDEIVAAISAAIAVISSEEGKNYRITDIKRTERNSRSAWNMAGIRENMR